MLDKDFKLPKSFKRMFVSQMNFTPEQKAACVAACDRARIAFRDSLRRKSEHTSAADPVSTE